jgi:hypothetical protein
VWQVVLSFKRFDLDCDRSSASERKVMSLGAGRLLLEFFSQLTIFDVCIHTSTLKPDIIPMNNL